MSNKVSLNELAALKLVLEFISVDELLTTAMNEFASHEDVKSKENERICFEALSSFLN